jgi:hypothetical protein
LAGERSGQVSQKKRQRGKKQGEHIMTHPGPAELSSLEKKKTESWGKKKEIKRKKPPSPFFEFYSSRRSIVIYHFCCNSNRLYFSLYPEYIKTPKI